MNKKGLSIVAALLALSAGSRVLLPNAAPGANRLATPPVLLTSFPGCNAADLPEPNRTLAQYFHPNTISTAAADMSHDWKFVPKGTKPAFLIATLPDPKATNLSLYFDRTLESVMWAINDAGYTFERSWLPWVALDEEPLYTLAERECRKRQLEARLDEPGILIFRSKEGDGVLLLFLVGETPTSGIRTTAFTTAVNDIMGIAGSAGIMPNEIRVIGPSFSGSLAPIRTYLYPSLKGTGLSFTFYSGMVTNGKSIKRFKEDPELKGRVGLQLFIQNDADSLNEFFKYLSWRSRYPWGWLMPNDIALLSEDETNYGDLDLSSLSGLFEEHTLVFRYPREIARLRNAYQDGRPQVDDRQSTSLVEGAKLSLKDDASSSGITLDKDSIGAFSKDQSPASQQAALLGIAGNLRRAQSDYVGILSTDVLDSLFLSTFLRQAFPDTRLFTLDADLLFVRENESYPLSGTLSITSYPLFAWNQHGTRLRHSVPRIIPFTSRSAEGIYNACASALNSPLLENTNPFNGSEPRPLWLTVVGRDGYWPVALLDDPPGGLGTGRPTPGQRPLEPIHPEHPGVGWSILFWMIFLFATVHSVYVLHGLLQPPAAPEPVPPLPRATPVINVPPAEEPGLLASAIRSSRTLLRVYPPATNGPSGHEIPYLLGATLTLAFAQLFLVFCFVPFWPFYSTPIVVIYFGLSCLGLALAVVVSGWLFLRSRSQKVRSRTIPRKLAAAQKGTTPIRPLRNSIEEYFWLIAPQLALSAIFFTGLIWLEMNPNYRSGYFFAYRSLSLTSGVSPIVPVLLLTISYFHWAWIQLQREQMIAQRRRASEYGAGAPEEAQRYMTTVNLCVENVFSRHIWWPALMFMALWLLLSQPWSTLKSFEAQPFGFLYGVLLVVLYWMIMLCWTQFVWTWRRFKEFLEWLERDQVRNAFSRLRKEITWVPLVSRPREHKLFITIRSVDNLRALCSFDPNTLSPDGGVEHARLRRNLGPLTEEARKLSARLELMLQDKRDPDPETYGKLQACLDEAAIEVLRSLQANEWSRGSSDSLEQELDEAADKALEPDEQLLILKEEIVALRYITYVRYIFRQLRNLLGFVIFGFIASILSIESYPFQRHQWLSFVAICVLVTLGTGVGVVFAQMDRDAILSRLTDTRANQIGKTFFIRMLEFGALPLFTILATQFPVINRVIFPWLRPALEALH